MSVALNSKTFGAAANFAAPSITVPSNSVSDIMVLVYGDQTSAFGTLTWPSGFTQVDTIAAAASPFATAVCVAMAWKKITGSPDSGTYSVTDSAGPNHAVLSAQDFAGASAAQFVTSGSDWSKVASNGSGSPVTTICPAITCGVGDALAYVAVYPLGIADAEAYTYPTVNQGTLTLVQAVQQGTTQTCMRGSELDNVSTSGTTGTASMIETGRGTNVSAFFFRIAAGSGGTTTTPASGAVALIGQAPTMNLGIIPATARSKWDRVKGLLVPPPRKIFLPSRALTFA